MWAGRSGHAKPGVCNHSQGRTPLSCIPAGRRHLPHRHGHHVVSIVCYIMYRGVSMWCYL